MDMASLLIQDLKAALDLSRETWRAEDDPGRGDKLPPLMISKNSAGHSGRRIRPPIYSRRASKRWLDSVRLLLRRAARRLTLSVMNVSRRQLGASGRGGMG